MRHYSLAALVLVASALLLASFSSTMLVAAQGGSTPLTLGQPVPGGSSQQFSYNVFSIAAFQQPVQVALTVTSGYPSLCVSRTPFNGGGTPNCDVGSTSQGSSQSQVLTLTAAQFNNGAYPIVVCAFGCNFTITALIPAATIADATNPGYSINLINGLPQFTIASGLTVANPAFFTFSIVSKQAITFTLTPRTGSVRMYVSVQAPADPAAFPNPATASSYIWSSNAGTQGGAASLIISATDPLWTSAAATVFRVSVIASTTNAAYTLTASYNGMSSTVLAFDSPFVDSVAPNTYEYFVVNVPTQAQQLCNMTIIVTPLTGDPDLYVSSTDQFPTAATCVVPNCKRANSIGADTVRYNGVAAGSYYIGVHAFAYSSQYALTAHLDCPNQYDAIQLTDGQPVNGQVDAGAVRYFALQLPNPAALPADITISLTRRSGDPDLFASFVSATPNPTSGATWRSVTTGADYLTISGSDSNYQCPSLTAPCVLTIGVYGFTAADFTIVVTTAHGSLRLIDGVGFSEDLRAGQYEYFVIWVDDLTLDLTVTVTALGRGDPDLFMSVTNPTPNASDYMWAARSYTADSITVRHTSPRLPNTVPYPMYISVFAYSAISFSVVASLRAPIELQLGVPQIGMVVLEEVRYFKLTIPPSQADLTFTLSTSMGACSMFISNTEQPKPSNSSTYRWSSLFYKPQKSVTFNLGTVGGLVLDQDGLLDFYIGIQGVGSGNSQLTNFTLLAFTGDSFVALQSGVPVTRSLSMGKSSYFTFRVENPFQDLAIIVTPITGDPDLYVSRVNQRPGPQSFEWRAVNFGGDVIPIANASVATYYIAVNAFLNSTFRLVVQLTDPKTDDEPFGNMVQLSDGVPQAGYVFRNNVQYYGFSLPYLSESLTITLVQTFGDPDVYVARDVNPCPGGPNNFGICTNAQWRSFAIGSDQIVIRPAQFGYYYLAVFGFQVSAFTITVTSRGQSILLQNGVPVNGNVIRGELDYYWLPLDSPNRDLTITVTALTGDPDLYVSRNTITPNATNNELSATFYGGDAITIPRTDPRFTVGANYYIAVGGYTPSTYIITASFNAATFLQDGRPQQGLVAPGAYVYYQFLVADSHTDVTIAVTPLTGNPNMYVTSNSATFPIRTDPTTYEWSSANWFSGENIIISHTDPNFCVVNPTPVPGSTPCVYTIGVFGQTASIFSIQITTSIAQLSLRDGVPVRDWVQTGKYDYFRYEVAADPLPGSYLTFTVTPFSGDPDLYASATLQYPNSTSGGDTKKSNYFGGDVITYLLPARGVYHVGVHAFLNTTFTLLAQYHSGNDSEVVTNLVNGVPQDDIVPSHRFRYYQLTLNAPHDALLVTLNRRYGDPDLYLAKGRLPTRTDFDRASLAFGRDLLTIPNVLPGVYYIGVYGFPNDESYYTLVAATSDAVITLLDGVAIRSQVTARQYQYFQIWVSDAQADMDLTITLTPLFGDPDLYVSDRYQRPNRTWPYYSYMSNSAGGDSITIPGSTLRSQMYYISVYGFNNATFTLVASFSNSTQLQDGIPQNGLVDYHVMKHYVFDTQVHVSTSFTLTSTLGSAWLYISNTEQPVFGNASTYQWSSTKFSGQQQISIPDKLNTICGSRGSSTQRLCRYYVGVLGARPGFNGGNSTSEYSLVAQTNTSVVTLQDGIPIIDYSPAGQYEYFSIDVPVSPAALFITLTPLSGDPDLYVSTLTQQPNARNYQWRSMYFGSDTVAIDSARDANFIVGTYYIGVMAFTDSAFSLSASILLPNASLSTPSLLIDGQPQNGLLEPGTTRYYKFYVPRSASSAVPQVTFTLTPRYGDPDIFVRNDGVLPTPFNSQWHSDRMGRDIITIPNTCQDCEYILAIRAFTRSLYTITAASGDAVTYLQSGVPHTGNILQGRAEYYSFDVPRGRELFVSLQDLGGGDPDLLVRAGQQPQVIVNADGTITVVADYKQNSFGSDSLYVASTDANTYYFGVYGFINSTYVITATWFTPGVFNTLLDGRPQLGYVTYDNPRLYAFQVTDPSQTKEISFVLQSSTIGATADFYINADCTPDINNDVAPPTPQNYMWASTQTANSQIRNSLTISPNGDVNVCFNGTYLVAVYASGTAPVGTPAPNSKYGVQFTMLASSQIVELSAGQPYFGAVRQGDYKYFEVVNDRIDQDMRITLSTYSGDADLYVSEVTQFPNATNNQWRSFSASQYGDYIVIPHANFTRPFQSVYIAVHGFSDSFFSLVVTTHFLQLVDGYSQNAVATNDQNSPMFFSFPVGQMLSTSLMLQFDPTSTDSTFAPAPGATWPMLDLYVSSVLNTENTFELNNCFVEPKASCLTNYPDKIRHFTINLGDAISIDPSSPVYCSSCVYYVGVVSKNVGQTSFMVTASTNNTVDTLTANNFKKSGFVSGTKAHYYEVFVNTPSFSVMVEPCTNDVSTYASYSTFSPSKDTWTWKSENSDAMDRMDIQLEHSQFSTLHVAVVANNPNLPAQYFISAVNNTVYNSFPQPGGVAADATMNAQQLNSHVARIKWAKATVPSNGLLQYSLYYVEITNVPKVTYTRCGLMISGTQVMTSATDAGSYLTVDVDGLDLANKGYVFNVVVTEVETQNYAVYTHSPVVGKAVLPPSGGDGGSGGGSNVGLILGIIIPVLAILVGAVLYLAYRNRKLTQELDIEMHDVPKAAVLKATRGPVSSSDAEAKRTEKYSALLQDASMDEDDYAPPDMNMPPVIIGNGMEAPVGHISRLTEDDRAAMLSNAV